MANSLNEVNLIGNMTQEPEIKETPNGHKVAWNNTYKIHIYLLPLCYLYALAY